MSDPDFGRIREPRSASAVMPAFSFADQEAAVEELKTSPTPTVGVTKRHKQHSSMKRASTIRIIGDSAADATPRRGVTSGADGLECGGTPQSLLNELQDGGQDMYYAEEAVVVGRGPIGRAGYRSPSPPMSSDLPPLRQSTRVEDLSGMDIDLGFNSVAERTFPDDDEDGMERLRDEDSEMDIGDHSIIPSIYPSLPGDNAALRDARSPSPAVPGAFPSAAGPKQRGSTRPDPFIFGSPAHGITNEQFSQASEAVLSEINAKLRDQGIVGIGDKILLDDDFDGEAGGAGSRMNLNGKQGRYALAHQKQFAK